MPQRPPSNSARKIAARPIAPGEADSSLSTEERRAIAPELLLDSSLAWEKYKLPIMLVVTLLVLGAVGWGFYQNYQAKNAVAASALLDAAKTDADYQKLIDAYPGTNAAANASLLLGRSKYNARDYAGAAQVWGAFATKFSRHPLVPDALIGEAGALEAQGKLDEARAMYQRVATSYQSSYTAPLARLSEATLLLGQRKTDEAKHVYEDLIASSPKSDVSQIAEQGLRTLNALPPLAGSPAASASPSPAAAAAAVEVVPPTVTAPSPVASPAAVASPVTNEPPAAAAPVVPAPPAVAEPSSSAAVPAVPPPGISPTPGVVAPSVTEPSASVSPAAPAQSPAATPGS